MRSAPYDLNINPLRIRRAPWTVTASPERTDRGVGGGLGCARR
jgi:hypothetical protein